MATEKNDVSCLNGVSKAIGYFGGLAGIFIFGNLAARIFGTQERLILLVASVVGYFAGYHLLRGLSYELLIGFLQSKIVVAWIEKAQKRWKWVDQTPITKSPEDSANRIQERLPIKPLRIESIHAEDEQRFWDFMQGDIECTISPNPIFNSQQEFHVWFEKAIKHQKSLIVLAKLDTMPVGFAHWKLEGKPATGWIGFLPEMDNLDIQKMITSCMAHLWKLGVREYHVYVIESSRAEQVLKDRNWQDMGLEKINHTQAKHYISK
jgi:hypothetical protein